MDAIARSMPGSYRIERESPSERSVRRSDAASQPMKGGTSRLGRPSGPNAIRLSFSTRNSPVRVENAMSQRVPEMAFGDRSRDRAVRAGGRRTVLEASDDFLSLRYRAFGKFHVRA